MKLDIQVINYTGKNLYNTESLYISTFEEPKSLDEFDLNILDLSDEYLWRNNNGSTNSSINKINDIISIKTMLSKSSKCKVLVVLPQNIFFKYGSYGSTEYSESIKLKDMIDEFKHILTEACSALEYYTLTFENTTTVVNEKSYNASFYFNDYDTILRSEKSCKPVLVGNDRYFFTTLDLKGADTDNCILDFVGYIIPSMKEEIPEWFPSIQMFDDTKYSKNIEEAQKAIAEQQVIIELSRHNLEINNQYKSVVYTSGDELVRVIFKILEEMLGIDLSTFVDEKKADLCFELDGKTVIGEIKGINTNIKNENLSQLDNHVQEFIDDNNLQDARDIVSWLIINHQRNKPIEDRAQVGQYQLALAERYGSLIIETITLLRLFEEYRNGMLSRDDIKNMLFSRKGLLIV